MLGISHRLLSAAIGLLSAFENFFPPFRPTSVIAFGASRRRPREPDYGFLLC